MCRSLAAVVAVALACPCAHASIVDEQPLVLSLPVVVQLARERAPAIAAARAHVDEAQARLRGARVWPGENPSLSMQLGARVKTTAVPDAQIALSQGFAAGRDAAVDAAHFDVVAAEAEADDVVGSAVHAAAAAFVEARAAEHVRAFADANVVATAALLHVATQRLGAGDVGVIDKNVAATATARAQAAQRGAHADEALALGALRAALGLGASTTIVFDDAALAAPPRLEIDGAIDRRPDVRALVAAADAAVAEARAAAARAWPDLGVGAYYGYDDGDHVVAGTVSVSLPVFQRGDAEAAAAQARADVARRQLDAVRLQAQASLSARWIALDERRAAEAALKDGAIVAATDNVRLARAAYAAGELPLFEVLAVEREAAAVNEDLVDAERAVALTLIDLLAEAGALL